MTLRLPQLSFAGGATLEFGYDQNYWIDDVQEQDIQSSSLLRCATGWFS